jgi:bacterioferritin-associated ferredoxin
VYACVCHAVTDDDVRCRIAEGACSTKEVRAACGMRPGCGSCVRRITSLIQEYAGRQELAAGRGELAAAQ